MDERAHLTYMAKALQKKGPIVTKRVEHDGYTLLLMSDNSVRWEYA